MIKIGRHLIILNRKTLPMKACQGPQDACPGTDIGGLCGPLPTEDKCDLYDAATCTGFQTEDSCKQDYTACATVGGAAGKDHCTNSYDWNSVNNGAACTVNNPDSCGPDV